LQLPIIVTRSLQGRTVEPWLDGDLPVSRPVTTAFESKVWVLETETFAAHVIGIEATNGQFEFVITLASSVMFRRVSAQVSMQVLIVLQPILGLSYIDFLFSH